ncbi:hypothetical protein EKK58_09695 [Candidatus Dependentiae bacterium]|nr:MAG: hypothetical protein EKK58_09695 [Candidatus Dependentiae bacterium]
MKNIERFLEFNGKKISILNQDGVWWVALKPICEALNVDFEAQRKNIQDDNILAQLPSIQTVVASDLKARKMLCLPEKYIYGWLFSIRSESQELKEYKLKCYDVLYNHFHGALTARMTILTEQDTITTQIAELEKALEETEEYKKIQELKRRKGETRKELTQLDRDLKSGQLSIIFN